MSTLHQQYLELELVTDICISSSNRTLSSSAPQRCVPGRLVWGVLATRAYQAGWSEADTFRVFHQGSVRFLDGLPLAGDAPAYPVPQTCQAPKDPSKDQGARNMALPTVRKATQDKGIQLKPLKDRWATATGQLVSLPISYSLRTSVDASGKARNGLLYGMHVLQGGQRFATALVGPKDDVDKVLGLLRSDTTLRLGRSRNAEMGLVKARVKGGSQRLADLTSSAAKATDRVSFLCISRCALRDPLTGAATVTPSPEAFGLDAGWTFEPASSFISTARVVHFNGYRKRPETERLVLERGSVVTFARPGGEVDLTALRARALHGVGDHTGEGYGEVAVAPAWLLNERSCFTEATDGTKAAAASEPNDELFSWANERRKQRDGSTRTFEAAYALIDELKLRRIKPSQWGALHRLAREARFDPAKRQGLLRQLKDLLHGDKLATEAVKNAYNKVIGERKIVVGGIRTLDPVWRSVRDPFLEHCSKQSEQHLPFFLEHLAGACMRPDPKRSNDGGERA